MLTPPPVHILSCYGQLFTPQEQALLEQAHIIAASTSLLHQIRQSNLAHCEDIIWHAWQNPLKESLLFLEAQHAQGKNIVVLADGDPLYFGIGATLAKRPYFAQNKSLHIHAGISMMQRICALACVPWHEVCHVSLHGRKEPHHWTPLYRALMAYKPVCVLTDKSTSVAHITRHLLSRGARHISVYCVEKYLQEDMHFVILDLEQAQDYEAQQPCTVLLVPQCHKLNNYIYSEIAHKKKRNNAATNIQKQELQPRPFLGIASEDICREKNLMTKPAVRATALSLLRLLPEHTFWDVGAGSGSLSIEAASLAGQVVAFEKHAQRIAHIQENRQRFNALNLEIVHGNVPQCFSNLPQPDAIFVGGGLSQASQDASLLISSTHDLLEALCTALKPGGRMVISAVLLGTLQSVQQFFQNKQWYMQLYHIQVSEGQELLHDIRLVPQNPVFLLLVEKQACADFAHTPHKD